MKRWMEVLKTDAQPAATILRVALGLIMLPHGAQHLLGWFGGYGFSGTLAWMTDTLGFPAALAAIAIVTELIAPIALILGIGGRLAALGIAGIMTGATLTHLPNGFFMNWFGSLPSGSEGYEYHLLVLFMSLAVIIQGSGALSIDRWITRRQLGTLALVLLLAACSDDQVTNPGTQQPVASVTLQPDTLTVENVAITASAGGRNGTATLRVIRPTPVVARLDVNPGDIALNVGDSRQLSIRVFAADGTELPTPPAGEVRWVSINPGAVSVDDAGRVTAHSGCAERSRQVYADIHEELG